MKPAVSINWDWVKSSLIRLERVSKPAITECVDTCLEEARPLTAPKLTAVTKKILDIKAPYIILGPALKLDSGYLSKYLSGADSVHIILVTIGNGIENKATSYMAEGDHLKGYLLDRVGSLAVESLARNVEERLREDNEKNGLSVSMRLSPGYCDWPVEEQFKLEKALDFSKAGVVLTKGCMMIPKKSITSVIGIGPKGLFLKNKSQCDMCDKKDCDYRRVFRLS
ncbi:MAG: vitamin B12 dependent-methionine synthase activation domain-containing protein [Candidatus Omnitrophota bacterium]|nr:vitamin B12 dependent-methionine synthase activation domain-containing protein [Candidatus Omnitrophota bacterium]